MLTAAPQRAISFNPKSGISVCGGDYGRAREGNANLSERLQEVKMEIKALRGTVADFERVKRAFDPEEVARAVEDTRRREAREREQSKAKRKFSRGVR